MKLLKFKRELLKISLILGLLNSTGCVKPSRPVIINNFCNWATPLTLNENDYDYLVEKGSDKLINHLDIFASEYEKQCYNEINN